MNEAGCCRIVERKNGAHGIPRIMQNNLGEKYLA